MLGHPREDPAETPFHGLNCVPPNSYIGVQPLAPQKVTSFGIGSLQM